MCSIFFFEPAVRSGGIGEQEFGTHSAIGKGRSTYDNGTPVARPVRKAKDLDGDCPVIDEACCRIVPAPFKPRSILLKIAFYVSAAAIILAACADTTAPNADLSVRDARPTRDPAITVTGNLVSDTYDFEDGGFATASSGTFFTIEDLDTGGFATSSPLVTSAYNGSTDFIGRVDNNAIFLVVPAASAGTTYSLAFDLYIIGSWDGQGQQAQHGTFGQDIWKLAMRCGTANTEPVEVLLETDFSNQLTVQQSYPRASNQKGGSKAGTGSYGTDLLGFVNDPAVHTPSFRSFGDTEYHLSFTGTNPCAPGENMIFSFIVPDAGLQSNYDESWGLDNVVLKTDS